MKHKRKIKNIVKLKIWNLKQIIKNKQRLILQYKKIVQSKQMIFDRTSDELNSWKNQMKQYEKGKRTKKPFGKSMPHVNHVSHEEIKNRQNKLNPILQTYKHTIDQKMVDSLQQITRVKSLMNHIKNVQKYQKQYDIINLCQNQGALINEKVINKKLGPIRNAYNVISNQKLPDFYFKGRDLQLPVNRQKNLIDYHKKQFDIITGDYKNQNEERQQKQKLNENLKVMEKYWKTHNYDPVYGKFYDSKKQQEYHNELEKQQRQHGRDLQKKLPVSYVYRQPLILDYEKPLPQSLRTLDQKQQNRKKKYQLKYVIEDQYKQRNEEQDTKYDQVIKNHIHDGRLFDEKAKQFNIITNKNYPQNRAESLYGKKPKINSWDQYIKPSDNIPKFIKTSGFNH